MKRELWTKPVTEQTSPAWPCPTCAKGTLALIPNSLIEKQTVTSKQRYDVLGDAAELKTTFSAWLRCNYGNCGEDAVMIGIGELIEVPKDTDDLIEEHDEGMDFGPKYGTIYEPLFCYPMPDMFELPRKCPVEVKAELRAAFRLFWSDQAAASGRVRVSLERLMDFYRIPKRPKLHDRIKKFSEIPEKHSSAGEKIMALKWLGNTGSHEGDVSPDDLLTGLELLEHILVDLFEKRSARAQGWTRRLMKKHAPRPRRKTK